ncbi:hypothetical protein B5F07_20250 [Lachnoclostridium sp. An169]|uniref:glycosyl hydrolase n=1 Tax=Lachnoclostridium sp. An169 TaxID=1965569 RepID=UPI000B3747AF|nr:glycosyl hydrolase [Lachnoclostridium sp. An169]OUP80678.1 hypothetical protein B5F07_20250 [Lachnoclostridium sp. An169]
MEKRNTPAIWTEMNNQFRPKIRYWLLAAAVEEEDLRLEIRQLSDRGFGGVEVVVLSSVDPEVLRSEFGWGTEKWDRAIEVIASETERLGMTMDLAIGPGWPIASPMIGSEEEEAVLCELTYGEMVVASGAYYKGKLPERRKKRNTKVSKLIHVMAYKEKDGNSDKVLQSDTYIDLTGYINAKQELDFRFPETAFGSHWKVFAFYQQPAMQKVNAGQTYVIDHLSRAGIQACEQYWDKVMEKYDFPSMESLFCDSL